MIHQEFILMMEKEDMHVDGFTQMISQRTDLQKYLFEKKCEEYDEETAATIVARPGTSEHQTGLAADITEEDYEYKSAILEDTAMYQWMEAHCQDYGFIVRFPDGKEDITGIIYEPWHFRYVGVEVAKYMTENDLCLEEFVSLYRDIYSADNPPPAA